jgi:hypothetical protein
MQKQIRPPVKNVNRVSPVEIIHKTVRSVRNMLRPPSYISYTPTICERQDAVLESKTADKHQVSKILYEKRQGMIPTIVLGGFVPEATEQVFLLRGLFLKYGSIYYFNYSHQGFSAELLFAQLEDLVEEVTVLHGQRPVIFSVSFSAGLVMEWLKNARSSGRSIDLSGLVLISPVACVQDLLDPNEAKPATLLGRALKPYIDPHKRADQHTIERSRVFFTKMFEAGAQNKKSLRRLMTRGELHQLRSAVMKTIMSVTHTGALERVRALKHIETPSSYFSQTLLPLSNAPTLILYSEKESSVIAEHSPTRFVLESAHHAYFPQSRHKIITNKSGSPVQHASLIFHYFNFLPSIADFYRSVKSGKDYAE